MAFPAVVAFTPNFSARLQANSRSAPLSQPKHRCAPAQHTVSCVRVHSPSAARETASQNLILSAGISVTLRGICLRNLMLVHLSVFLTDGSCCCT
jgi:hypothetical protein